MHILIWLYFWKLELSFPRESCFNQLSNMLRILSTTVYVNTSNTIKKAKIGQILDMTNNILYILLLNQFKIEHPKFDQSWLSLSYLSIFLIIDKLK